MTAICVLKLVFGIPIIIILHWLSFILLFNHQHFIYKEKWTGQLVYKCLNEKVRVCYILQPLAIE